MGTESVLIAAEKPASGTRSSLDPRYSLLLSNDPAQVEAAQRLRYDVFSSEPGFALTGRTTASTPTVSTSTVTICWFAKRTPVNWSAATAC